MTLTRLDQYGGHKVTLDQYGAEVEQPRLKADLSDSVPV
jgi:hypothetical protein